MPLLYHKGKSGELRTWQVWTEGATIVTQHGVCGGRMQIARKTAEPKNVGRANETTAEEQAVKEAKAMFTFKLDRKYSKTPEKAREEMFRPMLAKKFEDRKKKVKYPVDVQPKFDGYRCLARKVNGKVELLSRSGKPYYVEHIETVLEDFMSEGQVLDGELYAHGVPFNTVSSWIKKKKPESSQLKYYVYDMPAAISWKQRAANLRELACDWLLKLLSDMPHSFHETAVLEFPIKFVHSSYAENEQDVYELQEKFIGDGFEGAIVRGLDGIYRYGYRSGELLKVKTFDDAEFEIVDCVDGDGKFEGCAIWVCVTAEGKQFKATQKGTMAERKKLYTDRIMYTGKQLKVKYFGVSKDNIPRFPVGIGIRDEKDM